MSRKTNYGERWIPPSPEKIREAIKKNGGRGKAALILKKNPSTIHRWCTGEVRIDYANWRLLVLKLRDNKAICRITQK